MTCYNISSSSHDPQLPFCIHNSVQIAATGHHFSLNMMRFDLAMIAETKRFHCLNSISQCVAIRLGVLGNASDCSVKKKNAYGTCFLVI